MQSVALWTDAYGNSHAVGPFKSDADARKWLIDHYARLCEDHCFGSDVFDLLDPNEPWEKMRLRAIKD